MKVLVCGGRNFKNFSGLSKVMSNLEPYPTILVHGDARGADQMAGQWARNNGIEERRYPAKWKVHGKAAGFVRNAEMLQTENPDLVIAFPGGKGTQNMIDLAKKKGYKVRKYG